MNNTSLSSLDALARGTVAERFGTELDTILRNILDPNTKATTARKITLTITADGVVMATEIGRSNELPGQIDVRGEEFTPVSAGLTVLTGGRAAR